MKKLLLLIMVLSLAGTAGAAAWARPTVDGPGNWSDVANWEVAEGVPIATTVVTILGQNPNNLAEAQVTDAQTFGNRLRLGNNSPGQVLRIMDGGALSSGPGGTRSYIGDSFDGQMIIEAGGSLTHNHRLYVGNLAGVTGILDIAGDLTISILQNLYVGNLGVGFVNISGDGVVNLVAPGALKLAGAAGSKLDITENGSIVFLGSVVNNASALLPSIYGNGVLGNVEVNFDGANTIITALDDPLERTPAYGGYGNASSGNVDLSWINLAPIDPATDVYVDVYFGTDITYGPNASDPNIYEYTDFEKVASADLNITGATVPTPVDGGVYFWRVDTYRNGDPAIPGLYEDLPDDGDPNTSEDALYEVDEGSTMYFTALSDFPPEAVVIDTPPTVTWKGNPIAMTATITDDQASALNIVWSVTDPQDGLLSDPNVVFTNVTYTYPTATADMTINYHAAQVDVTIEVSDGGLLGGYVSDTVRHDVTDSACQATGVLGIIADHPADIDENCIIDLADVAVLAFDWLSEYALTEPTVIP